MSGDNAGNDILEQYRNILNKLKKRFLRKPNVTEACESFTALGQQCETQELPAYAGLCWIAAARCEGSLGNIPGETAYLIRSGRQFLEAEKDDFLIGCSNVPPENLQSGISCFAHASSKFDENSPVPIAYNLEIVDFLNRIDRHDYVQDYLEQCLQLSIDRYDTNIHCLQLLASHFMNIGDYVGALETYKEIATKLEDLPIDTYRAEILLKCEICSVFLLLILRPSPQKLPANLAKILEKYTWGDKSDKILKASKMSEKIFLLMQSLVMACQSVDTKALMGLEGEFWTFLSSEQKDLLHTLIKTYCSQK